MTEKSDRLLRIILLHGKTFGLSPPLYQRVRIDSIRRDKKKDRAVFERRLKMLIDKSAAGMMFGDWDDYGRLLSD